jgi:hypothetical protein
MPEEKRFGNDSVVFQFLKAIAAALLPLAVAKIVASSVSVGVVLLGAAACCYAVGAKWDVISAKAGTRLSSILEKIVVRVRYPMYALLFVFVLGYVISMRNDFDTYTRPRSVTAQQSDEVHGFLSHRKLYSVTVKVNPRDEEALDYAGQIFNALKLSGWKVEFSTADAEPNTLNSGLCIEEIGINAKPELEQDPATILHEAFRAAEIDTNCSGSVGAGVYKLYVLVGHRPLKIGLQHRFLFKLGGWLTNVGRRLQSFSAS